MTNNCREKIKYHRYSSFNLLKISEYDWGRECRTQSGNSSRNYLISACHALWFGKWAFATLTGFGTLGGGGEGTYVVGPMSLNSGNT